MLRDEVQPPPLLPILSRGKHRNPRKGACFMELASLLAGERWSDHPACTHRLLAAERQRVMAVAVLACERVLAELERRPAGSLGVQSRSVLAQVPHAARWAERFTSGIRTPAKRFGRQAAPLIVGDAVEGIAQACVPDPDGMLRDLLAKAIQACAACAGRDPGRDGAFHPAGWASAGRRSGSPTVAATS
jgi:hypothetical protein